MTFRATLFSSVVLSLLFGPVTGHAEIVPIMTYRLCPTTVYESRPVTTYRLQEETVLEQKPITVYKTETVTEMREQRYRVAKPVVETSERVQRYKVMRPVTETSYREEFVDRTTYETETRWREERRIVQKPLAETSEREERRTVLRPVTEYDVREEEVTTYRPYTTTETQWEDRSGYVEVPKLVPGPVRNRLRWLPRTSYQNPATGLATSQRAGLYWVPEQRPGTWTNQTYYVPQYVPHQVQRTYYAPEKATRQVPVQRTRYEEEVQYRKVPVTTQRIVSEEQYRYVPETVRKPVTTRYTRKVPVTRTRWEEQEVVRRIPVKTYRMEYEDKVEQVPVQVQRSVPVQQWVQRERTVRRYVPYVREQLVAKTVMARQPIAANYQVLSQPMVETVTPLRHQVARPQHAAETILSPWRLLPAEATEVEIADTAPSLKVEAEADPAEPLEEDDAFRGTKPLSDLD